VFKGGVNIDRPLVVGNGFLARLWLRLRFGVLLGLSGLLVALLRALLLSFGGLASFADAGV
jgi:hypothetical protein